MADEAGSSVLEDSDNEVDFTDIDNLRLTYQKAISNNGMIAFVYKTMKKIIKMLVKKFN